ncbi:uncharacterized protein [Rutidosis leptorrhynchoides]|uniref:uncharacterized protein n=1 Tax=Rutidosis leptorrhynchoides TaxID=125765 RepID=UPI003A99CB47
MVVQPNFGMKCGVGRKVSRMLFPDLQRSSSPHGEQQQVFDANPHGQQQTQQPSPADGVFDRFQTVGQQGDDSVDRRGCPGAVQFEWCWLRAPRGCTAGELEELCNLLKTVAFDFKRQESWSWSLASNGLFKVKKLSKLIDGEILGAESSPSHETLRNNLVPKKIEVFVWRALKKRLPTRVELNKRGINLHSVRCPVCDDGLESVDHALFDCKFTSDVWSRVLKWWNFNPITSSSELLRGKSSLDMSPLGLKIWQAVEWICTYSIWKNRNSLVFKGKSNIAPMIVNEIQVKSFEWISARNKDVSIDWLNWLVSPHLFVGS